MTHKGNKLPFAPWGDRNASAECTKSACATHFDSEANANGFVAGCEACCRHRDETVTCADCDHDARWKWGYRDNWASKATADEWVEMDPEVAGHVAIISDADPFAFVDGDDVRDPETDAVHPAFIAVLEKLGLTYADVSTSDTGNHALYVGELPDGVSQVTFDLDDEPWGSNDDVPSVEIYDGSGQHVCVATGRHVAGTPTGVRAWDDDGLATVLDEYGPEEDPQAPSHDTDRDHDALADYEPTMTRNDETTDDIRDVLAAVDRLRPRDLPLRTRQVGHDATGWEQWNPSSYRSSAGNDSLHRPPGEAVFHDQKTGQSFGVLSLFAAEQDIISKPWHSLRREDWRAAVDAARDAGAPIPEYDGGAGGDPDRVAILPDTDALDNAASGWDWRHAACKDDRALTMEGARDRTQTAIADAYDRNDRMLIEALPTMGKTYGAVKAAAETGEPITFLTGRGHKEQYDQLRKACDDLGLDDKLLPSFFHDCDTANGEHGAEWRETVRRWYGCGATPKEIHAYAESVLGRPLPCQQYDGQECPYTAKWRFDPDEYDVLIGHYNHAHNQKTTQGRTVVIDEFPGDAYETTLGSDTLTRAVSYWLSRHDSVPYDDYTDLLEGRDDPDRRGDALAWFTNGDTGLALDTDETHVFDDDHAHAAAPLAVVALLTVDDLGNGVEHADLGDAGQAVRDRETGALTLLRPPSFDYASGIVTLDGTPTQEMWETALGTRLTHRQVLSEPERREYIEGTLNLQLVRTTDAVKSYSARETEIANRVSLDDDRALLDAVHGRHHQRPAVITTKRAKTVYEDAGVLEEYTSGVKHYGNVLGSNEYDDKRVGAVLGSRNLGPKYVKKWGAYLDETIAPTYPSPENDFTPTDYGPVGNKIRTHMREHETLQAAMRFGRDGNGAVVYVHTNTLPDWVPLAGEGCVLKAWSDGMKQVLEATGDLGDEWTTADVYDHPAVDLSRQQVFTHLESLFDRGKVNRQQDPCDGRRYLWLANGLHRIGDHGDVELPPVDLNDLNDAEVRKLARTTTYTWEFTNSPPNTRGSVARDTPPGESADETPSVASFSDGPPP
jgi:hypothetical protein